MQKDREILADGLVAQRDQFIGLRTHNDVIVIDHRSSQPFVADSAANQIGSHAGILPCRAYRALAETDSVVAEGLSGRIQSALTR